MRRCAALAGLAMLGGCGLFQSKPVVTPRPDMHTTVGAPYQAGGVWRYPKSEYGVDRTGLAALAADRTGLTADGEVFDQTAMAAGDRTLQLPAIVRVTNLENGRQVVLRLNDRGPTAPSRLIALTRRAASLLDARDGTRIRMQMMDAETRQLAATTVTDEPALAVAAAPRGAIASESLAPPGGTSQSGRVRVAAAGRAPGPDPVPIPALPLRLPETVSQSAPRPGQLYIDAGAFSRQDYASILVNRLAPLGARLTTSYNAPRDTAYRIRIGPFATVPEAEAMLTRTISAGVNDAAIVVE